jgi:hypothetical protein
MLVSTRRRALESAGKIALGCYFGALGAACGGLSNDGGNGTAESETAAAPAASDGGVPAAPEPSPEETTPALACLAPVEVIERRLAVPVGREAEACCVSYVESVAGSGPARPGAELALDASLLNCCRALAWGGSFDTNLAHTTCCYGDVLPTADREGPYCSPWGPPVPPALVNA